MMKILPLVKWPVATISGVSTMNYESIKSWKRIEHRIKLKVPLKLGL